MTPKSALFALIGFGCSLLGSLFLIAAATPAGVDLASATAGGVLLIFGLWAAATAQGGLKRPWSWAVLYPIVAGAQAAILLPLGAAIIAYPSVREFRERNEVGILVVLVILLIVFLRWAKADENGRIRWWP